MRARQITLGVVSYLGGAAALLVISLAITRRGLLQAIDASDAIVLLSGAFLIGLAALALQRFEVLRPVAAKGAEGGRPRQGEPYPKDDFSWSSLAAIFGAALATAVVPQAQATTEQVEPARGSFENLVIDGDRDGTSVTLVHNHIDSRWTAAGQPCARCHHLNLPGEDATPCAECHRSMSQRTDIFDHDLHADAEGGNRGCTTCHADPDEPRSRETMARPCTACHTTAGDRSMQVMAPEGGTVPMGQGLAPSYTDAMHRLCLECHRTIEEEHARCAVCHRTGDVREGQQSPE